jgi:hypothetical protein
MQSAADVESQEEKQASPRGEREKEESLGEGKRAICVHIL